jgi:Lon protease-like protein
MQEPASRFLRLFPLGSLVLFPGMELPLTVFEPRYVQLTSECTDTEEPFGVLLLKEGREVGDQGVEPYEIGTTAHILNVTDAGQGRLNVMAVGGQRFRVRSFNHEHPYLAAEVEYLNDDSAALVEPSLVASVKEDAAAFVRALMAMRGGFIRDVPLPDDPTALSYRVAQFFQGDASVQQRLLERETFDRLWDELDLIKGAMRRVMRRERRQGPGQSFSAN